PRMRSTRSATRPAMLPTRPAMRPTRPPTRWTPGTATASHGVTAAARRGGYARGGMPQDVFYQSVSTASFTLLGLWLVVVQARDEWRFVLARRRGADHASLRFFLPG